MNEEIQFCLDSAGESMDKSIVHFEAELLKIRAGRANPQMLSGVMVDYYGSMTALPQVANVGTPDARTLTVQPWEKVMLAELNKAIINSNLGFSPMDNGEMLIINIPPLTEERRVELAKRSKGEGENCKVSIRSARKDANDEIKKLGKDGLAEDVVKDSEASIQKLTDTYIAKVEAILKEKEAEIMKV
jgi:ribosome recycling factor